MEEGIKLNIDGEEFHLEKHNTDIYKHLGRYAIYDHIYHAPDDQESVVYLFNMHNSFQFLLKLLISKGFEVHEEEEPLPTDKYLYQESLLDFLEGEYDWDD